MWRKILAKLLLVLAWLPSLQAAFGFVLTLSGALLADWLGDQAEKLDPTIPPRIILRDPQDSK